jgi:hypothetical protein
LKIKKTGQGLQLELVRMSISWRIGKSAIRADFVVLAAETKPAAKGSASSEKHLYLIVSTISLVAEPF